MKDRMVFLERNCADPMLANAVLSAPAFLSGLTEGELASFGPNLNSACFHPRSSKRRSKWRRLCARLRSVGKERRPGLLPVAIPPSFPQFTTDFVQVALNATEPKQKRFARNFVHIPKIVRIIVPNEFESGSHLGAQNLDKAVDE